MTKEIPLTQGKVAIVDAEDHEELSKYTWCYDGRYASRMRKGNKKEYLHRRVLKTNKTEMVDHKNGDKLDNRKENLRLANHQQNSANSRLHKHNTSGYRGVYRYKNKWRAAVTYKGRQISCGYFNVKEEAAKAYNAKALKLFGEFARLNEIKPAEETII